MKHKSRTDELNHQEIVRVVRERRQAAENKTMASVSMNQHSENEVTAGVHDYKGQFGRAVCVNIRIGNDDASLHLNSLDDAEQLALSLAHGVAELREKWAREAAARQTVEVAS